MVLPIFSSTPATPRSEEKTAKARTMNSKVISTVSNFRLIVLVGQDEHPVSMESSSQRRSDVSAAAQ